MVASNPRPNPVERPPSVRADGEALCPLVSVVLPVRNEGPHIQPCLERLLSQDYPAAAVEILVIDGRSDDDTVDRVREVQQRHPDADLRLLDNPQRTVPHALNLGIRAARGDVIVRMDGHAVPSPDYLSTCVAALERSGAANVGGVVVARGATPFGHAVALVTQHPLGAGDARYRIGGEAGDVDTVPFGAFRRDLFRRVGLFDESLVRNQDYEFNVRVRSHGERVYFDPAIRFAYTPRGNVRSLWSQYFQYGWWKVETVRRHPRSLRWRQLLPPAFFLGTGLAAVLAPWWSPAAWALAVATVAYVGTVGAVATRIARVPATPVMVALAFAVIHAAWSLGFLLNAVSRGTVPFRSGPPNVPQLDLEPTAPVAGGPL